MLSEELFERDEDAYIDAATGLVMKAGRGAVPGVVRQIALNHLQDVLQRSGFGGRFDAWATDLDEAVCTAYLIAAAEQWDVEELDELLDECMEELNDLREAVGSDRVERDDLNTWLSILLIGFAHEGDEMDPLLEYVEEQGAWERIDSLRPTFEMIGAHLADPAPREKESWQAFNHFAWRDGIFMALLDKAGVFGEAKPGALTLAEGDRPLSAELYERDTQAYLLKAGELSSTTAHRVPDVARELYWHLIEPMLRDFKAAPDYGQLLQDMFEVGYVLSISERWDGVDPGLVRAQMDDGLRRLIAERDNRPAELLLPDPEYRIRNVAYGVLADTGWFEPLAETVKGCGAWERLFETSLFMLTAAFQLGPIKRRHRDKIGEAFRISFDLGVMIGLLDQLGEVPPTMPARL
jgi:hypothetical protein